MNKVVNWLCLSHHCIHRAFWKGRNNPSRSHTSPASLRSWFAFFLDISSPVCIYTLQEVVVLQSITRMAAAIFQQVWSKSIGLGWRCNGLWIQYQIRWREWQTSRECNKEILIKTSILPWTNKHVHLASFCVIKSPFLSYMDFSSQNHPRLLPVCSTYPWRHWSSCIPP